MGFRDARNYVSGVYSRFKSFLKAASQNSKLRKRLEIAEKQRDAAFNYLQAQIAELDSANIAIDELTAKTTRLEQKAQTAIAEGDAVRQAYLELEVDAAQTSYALVTTQADLAAATAETTRLQKLNKGLEYSLERAKQANQESIMKRLEQGREIEAVQSQLAQTQTRLEQARQQARATYKVLRRTLVKKYPKKSLVLVMSGSRVIFQNSGARRLLGGGSVGYDLSGVIDIGKTKQEVRIGNTQYTAILEQPDSLPRNCYELRLKQSNLYKPGEKPSPQLLALSDLADVLKNLRQHQKPQTP